MAKSMRSNRRRQLRSQHRTSLAKTTAFKVKDATKQDLIDRIAAVGAAQRQQEAEARPAPVEEDIAAAPPSEQEQLEAQLLDQMIHPRKKRSTEHGRRTAVVSSKTSTKTSQHHKRRKQRGARNPGLHFGHNQN